MNIYEQTSTLNANSLRMLEYFTYDSDEKYVSRVVSEEQYCHCIFAIQFYTGLFTVKSGSNSIDVITYGMGMFDRTSLAASPENTRRQRTPRRKTYTRNQKSCEITVPDQVLTDDEGKL